MASRARIGLAVAAALGAVFGLHRIVDPDPFQRVALGREILANVHRLGASHLLYTYPGYPFVDDKWLASVLVAAAAAAGGTTALMLYQMALPALVAGAWYRMLRVWGAFPSIALAATGVGLVADAYRLEPRPDTISQVLLAVIVALLGARVRFRRALVAVAATMALWVNLHGYFVEGLLALAAAGAAALIGEDRLLPSSATERRGRIARITVLLASGSVACFLHPQGIHAFLWPWRQLAILRAHPVLERAIQEFFPTAQLFDGTSAARGALLSAGTIVGAVLAATIGRRHGIVRTAARLGVPALWLLFPGPGFAGWPYRVTFALLAAAIVEIPTDVRSRRIFPLILLAGFGALAVPMVRNLSILPPLALLVIAPAWSREMGARSSEPRDVSRRAARAAAVAAALVVVGAGWARLSDRLAPGGYRAPGWTGWGIEDRKFPVAAADYLIRDSVPRPILNDFDDGGFLLARLGAGAHVFIADNTSMYPPEFLASYRRDLMGEGGTAGDPFRRFGARTVILDHCAMETPKLVRRLAGDPDWVVAYLDRVAVVFVHRDPATEDWLASHPVGLDRAARRLAAPRADPPIIPRWLGGRRHLFPAMNYALFLQEAGRPDLALEETDRLWREGAAPEVATLTAEAAQAAGRLPDAIPRLESALDRDPRSAPLRAWLSRALFYRADGAAVAGRFDAARADLERCRTLTPREAGPWLALARIAAQEGDRRAAVALLAGAIERSTDGSVRRNAEGDPLLAPLLSSAPDAAEPNR